MKNLFSNLQKFLQYSAENKIWAFATTVFIWCFWFAVNTYISTPNQKLELERRERELDRAEQEWEGIDAIYQHVESGLVATEAAQATYYEFQELITKEQKMPEREVILEYYLEIIGYNNDISRSIANLESVSSNHPVIDNYAKEFASDLETYKITFDNMEKVFMGVLEEDNENAEDIVWEQILSIIERPIYFEKSWNRLEGYSTEANSIMESRLSDAQILYNDKKLFIQRGSLALGASIYMALFLVVAGRAWYLYSHKKNQKSKSKRKRHK